MAKRIVDKLNKKLSKKKTFGYKRGWKQFGKSPSIESIVSAIAGGSAKNKTWRSVTGTFTDIAGLFSPTEAQKLRKIAMEGSGLSEDKIRDLLKQQGITAAKLQRSYEDAIARQSSAMMRTGSSATEKARRDLYNKATKKVDEAARKVYEYGNRTSQAVNDLQLGLSGDKDITETYNKAEKLIKED